MTGKPFALVGVNSDGDLARVKAEVEKEKITWPSFRDGGPFGSVAKAWNVVQVLKAAGKNLTRAGLMAVARKMNYSPGNKNANPFALPGVITFMAAGRAALSGDSFGIRSIQ